MLLKLLKLLLCRLLVGRLTLQDVRRRNHERTGIQFIHDVLKVDVSLSHGAANGMTVHTDRQGHANPLNRDVLRHPRRRHFVPSQGRGRKPLLMLKR